MMALIETIRIMKKKTAERIKLLREWSHLYFGLNSFCFIHSFSWVHIGPNDRDSCPFIQ
jgi:hypothetical protein